jgi:NAD(P)-dependent dehydrogenase (short-subunit alcohol dehydrogenase family)
VGYNSAKAGVIMLTKTLATEWAHFGIRVNAIAPGYMITPPIVELQRADPKLWETWISTVPMRRAGEPSELQGAAVFLASDASSYVSGTVIVVDGGCSS